MPRMDGFQFCPRGEEGCPAARVPFIFYIATYTDPKDEAFALSLGADHFLVKLTRLGYQPVTTTDPLRALELFRAEPFDLVITDLTVPRKPPTTRRR